MISEGAAIGLDEFALLKQAVRQRGGIACRVASGSMEPFLPVGEKLRLEPVDPDKVKRFDLIVFRDLSGLLFCHFVWRKNSLSEKASVTTRSLRGRGTDDLPAELDAILGMVVSHRLPARFKLKAIVDHLVRGR